MAAILIPCLLLQLFGCYSFQNISVEELSNKKERDDITFIDANDYEYLCVELEVAIGIAFKHQRFTKENPFFIMLVDYKNNPLPVGELPKMIENMIEEKYKEHKDKIKIQITNSFAN